MVSPNLTSPSLERKVKFMDICELMRFEEVNIEKGLKSNSWVPSNILSKQMVAQNPKTVFEFESSTNDFEFQK